SENAQDFRDHLARFPGGTTERFARGRLEELVWTALGSAPSLDLIDNFRAEFPQGQYAKEAAERRGELEHEQAAERKKTEQQRQEERAWAAASAAGDVTSLEAFLKEWPRTEHWEEAQS